MLLVDSLAFGLETVGLTDPALKELLPWSRHTTPSRRSLGQMEPLLQVLEGRVDPETREYLENCLASEQEFYRAGFPEYIGTDCTMEELPQVLAQGRYRFEDQAVYDDYAVRYSAGLDGKAFLRIAEVVESVEREPRTAAKLEAQGSLSLRYGALLKQSWKSFAVRVKNRLAGAAGGQG